MQPHAVQSSLIHCSIMGQEEECNKWIESERMLDDQVENWLRVDAGNDCELRLRLEGI